MQTKDIYEHKRILTDDENEENKVEEEVVMVVISGNDKQKHGLNINGK